MANFDSFHDGGATATGEEGGILDILDREINDKGKLGLTFETVPLP
jgi:hypothetical protein